MAIAYPLHSSCVIDCETVASPDVAFLLDPVRAPSNYRDPHKISAYQEEKLAEKIANASLEPDLCEVVALGCACKDDEVEVLTRAEADEAQMLEWFWDRVAGCRLIGYNILQFDLPVLMRRSQLLGVSFPLVNVDRYRTPHVDLLQRLSFNGLIAFRSLNFYIRRFAIDMGDIEDPVIGAEIPQLVRDGEWALIHAHCLFDIKKTRALAERLGLLLPSAAVAS